ncbi:MAG TPA: glycosyltransferase N-terminal domain-containing protein [Bacteroidales bacterium]|nr:glycosyltransferase N-terminal domain-containing protein [Bacteroidales bacterium]
MSLLYDIFIAFYTLFIRFAALFNDKARSWVSGRKGWKEELLSFSGEGKIAWFHAASLGEFEQGRPVMEAFRQKYPGYRILLTFFSPSGYQQRKDYKGADKVMYLPPDCRRNARHFVGAVKPDVAIFIKYEFWYNYLYELKKNSIPVIFISVLFRRHQPFFKWYGGWFRKRLRTADHFFVQDQVSLDLVSDLGITQASISGDTRFDRVADILNNKTENIAVEAFCKGQKTLLAGSTWPPDEVLLKELLSAYPQMKMIIAPHEVKAERIRQLIESLGSQAARYTMDKPEDWLKKQVLIIDTIGVLSSIYRYADIAYIGGAFGSGLHNIQEPAVNGMPVIFGPSYHKFREAVDLVKMGGAFSIRTSAGLNEVVGALLNDQEKYQRACGISKKYMFDNTGATARIMEGLAQFCQ